MEYRTCMIMIIIIIAFIHISYCIHTTYVNKHQKQNGKHINHVLIIDFTNKHRNTCIIPQMIQWGKSFLFDYIYVINYNIYTFSVEYVKHNKDRLYLLIIHVSYKMLPHVHTEDDKIWNCINVLRIKLLEIIQQHVHVFYVYIFVSRGLIYRCIYPCSYHYNVKLCIYIWCMIIMIKKSCFHLC